MNIWMQSLLSEVPTSMDDDVHFVFKSKFVGSYLICNYSENKASFSSNLVSTLAIIKNFILSEAN